MTPTNAPVVHATTACLPTRRYEDVAAALAQGVSQEPWGKLSTAEIQVCPQHPHFLNEELLDEMASLMPGTRMRLHATAPVSRRHFVGPRAWWSDESQGYWERVAELSRHIKASAYTFHAGTREGHTFDEMLDQARRFEQLFECPVGIEGLYPDVSEQNAWFVNSWEEYRRLMESGVRFALDLSHMNIMAKLTREIDEALVVDMLSHPNCIEIHVSDNDGMSDRHQMMRPEALTALWWAPMLQAAAQSNPGVLIFSESARPWSDVPLRNMPIGVPDRGELMRVLKS
jgi:sugar phosphate isomerase/epimerase